MINSLCLFLYAVVLRLDTPVLAATQQTYAVIVGISDYAMGQPGKGDLNFADDDARLFANMLQSAAGGSVPAANMILLTERQATRTNIISAMRLFRRAAKNDRIIFFFSGHGDQGMLLPYDAAPGVVVLHNDVKLAFRQSSALTKLLLADACKSGSMYRSTLTKTPVVHAPSRDNNIVVMLSSRANQFSQELAQLKHGAFTYYLVQGASGKADADGNQTVTMRELYAYMRNTIQQATHNQQTPVVFGRFSSDMPFAVVAH